MKNFRVKIGFSALSDLDLQDSALHILQRLTGNPSYLTPNPTLLVLQTSCNKFAEKLAKSANGKGGIDATAEKNSAREALIFILQDLGRYVETTANNDYTVLLSSGFEVPKDPTPGSIPAVPSNIVVKDAAHSGECKVHFDASENSLMYELRHSSTMHPAWVTSNAFTKREYIILGQTRGDDVRIQVRAMNGHGTSDWSQVAAWFAR